MTRKSEKFYIHSNFNEVLRKVVLYRKAVGGNNARLGAVYEELAEYTGVTVNTINKMKQSFGYPSMTVAIKVAEYLELSVTDIWEIKENLKYVDQRERCKENNCNKLSVANNLCTQHYHIELARKKKEKQENLAMELLGK